MNLIDQINSHSYLFLDNLVQVNEVELIVFVSEGKIDENTEKEISFPNEVLLKTHPIKSDERCKKYKITFKNFLTYIVVDESYIEWDESEEFVGGLFRIFSKSRFLDYISSALNARHFEDMNGKKYQHYEIACLNHIFDIACPSKPIVEEIKEKII